MHTTFSLQSVHLFYALYGSSFIVLQSLHVILYIFSFLRSRSIARFLARFFVHVANGRHFARSPNPMSARTMPWYSQMYIYKHTRPNRRPRCVLNDISQLSLKSTNAQIPCRSDIRNKVGEVKGSKYSFFLSGMHSHEKYYSFIRANMSREKDITRFFHPKIRSPRNQITFQTQYLLIYIWIFYIKVTNNY